MSNKEISPQTPTNELVAERTELENSLATIEHSPQGTERINRRLAYIGFELVMREGERSDA